MRQRAAMELPLIQREGGRKVKGSAASSWMPMECRAAVKRRTFQRFACARSCSYLLFSFIGLKGAPLIASLFSFPFSYLNLLKMIYCFHGVYSDVTF